MKTNFIKSFLIFAAISVAFSSCQKDDSSKVVGSYTYKISGTLGLVPASSEGSSADTTYMTLTTEQGQMHVARYEGDNKVIVTWNDIQGEACHATATMEGSKMRLDEGQKNISAKSTLLTYDATVKFTGEGSRYDDMLIILMNYSGSFNLIGTEMSIVSSNVECIATAN